MLFKFKVVVKDDERAFLTRDGRFERVLDSGRFAAFDHGRHLAAEVVRVVRTEISPEKALLLARTHPDVAAENFEIVQGHLANTLRVPLEGLFKTSNGAVVFVKKGDRYLPQPVKIGRRSATGVAVLSGLKGGEQVALRRPPSRFVDPPPSPKVTGRQGVKVTG